jgi:hypothetical protein
MRQLISVPYGSQGANVPVTSNAPLLSYMAPNYGTLYGSAQNMAYTPAANGAPDQIFVAGYSPTDGQRIIARSDVTVTGNIPGTVQVYLGNPKNGGTLLATQPLSASGSLSFSTAGLPNGPQQFFIVAQDSGGGTTTQTLTYIVDNIPPVIIPPINVTNNSNTNSTIGFNVTATDNVGVAVVRMRDQSGLDHDLTQQADGTWTIIYNTAQLLNGTYAFDFRAVDLAGNVSTPVSVSVAVNNPPNTSANIIIAPKNNDLVRAITNINADTSNISLVTSVDFKFDGALGPSILVVQSNALYTYSWNTADGTVADGLHTIEVDVHSSDGSLHTQSIVITVDNTAPSILITRPGPTEARNVYGNQVLESQASDANGLDRVEYYLGAQLIALLPGRTDGGNTYDYILDTTKWPDGDGYQLIAVAVDKAGNKSQASIVFKISNATPPPLSLATVLWHPAQKFVVTDPDALVSATVQNGTLDLVYLTQVKDNVLTVYVTKDGVRQQLPGHVTYDPQTGALLFNGRVPENSIADCIFDGKDTSGKAVRDTFTFTRAMPQATGGIASVEGGRLSVVIPPGALSTDQYVSLSLIPNAQAVLEANQKSASANQQTVISGPYDVFGVNATGTIFKDLGLPAVLSYSQPASEVPATQAGYVLEPETLNYDNNIWIPLGTGASATHAQGGPGARSVSVSISRFGTFRITAQAAPTPGISDLYNYPNPFDPNMGGTTINYILGANSDVTIGIYDLFGGLVRTIRIPSGQNGGIVAQNTYTWDGRNGQGDVVANGGYIVQIIADDHQGNTDKARRKVAVVK